MAGHLADDCIGRHVASWLQLLRVTLASARSRLKPVALEFRGCDSKAVATLNSFVKDAAPKPLGFVNAWTLVVLLALCLCGCSSFNRDWKRAAITTGNEHTVAGRWEGGWSSSGGHHGQLRCLMGQESNSVCQARFRATYGGIFHFTYTVPLEMQVHDIGWEFNGEANLGKLAGGVYYYEGRATTTNLISTYRSKYEHGEFELTRPK
jgi:hypothetical protein